MQLIAAGTGTEGTTEEDYVSDTGRRCSQKLVFRKLQTSSSVTYAWRKIRWWNAE